jgi:hypothetical protein
MMTLLAYMKDYLRDEAPAEETLAKRLAQGPMPLGYALRCATEIAASLLDLHAEGRAHGSVGPDSIALASGEAVLLPPRSGRRQSTRGDDIAAYGALLRELVSGSKHSAGSSPPMPPQVPHSGQKSVEAAVARLASKCLRASESGLEMRGILTEVRLLSILARMYESGSIPRGRKESEPAPQMREAPKTRLRATSQSVTPLTKKGFLAPRRSESAKPAASELRCPKCRGSYVHPSRPRTRVEEIIAFWGVPLLRCHRCFHRYLVLFGNIRLAKEAPFPFTSPAPGA